MLSMKIRDAISSPPEEKKILKCRVSDYRSLSAKKNIRPAVYSNSWWEIFYIVLILDLEEVHYPNFNAKILVIQKNLEFQVFLLPGTLTGSFYGRRLLRRNQWILKSGVTAIGYYPTFTSFIRKEKSNPFFQCIFV